VPPVWYPKGHFYNRNYKSGTFIFMTDKLGLKLYSFYIKIEISKMPPVWYPKGHFYNRNYKSGTFNFWAKISESCPRVQISKVAPKLGKNQ